MRTVIFPAFVALLMATFLDSSSAGEQRTVVGIPTLGRISGSQLSSVSGRKFHAFRAIPYARPPVGELRFQVRSILFSKSNFWAIGSYITNRSTFVLPNKKDPVPAKAWDDVLDASREGPICTQFNSITGEGFVHGQEDCLYLNVYTPQVKQANMFLSPRCPGFRLYSNV